MGIPFYARSISGSAKGSDGSSAMVVTAGDGLGLWTEQLGDNKCSRQDDPANQPSRNMSARFERTEKCMNSATLFFAVTSRISEKVAGLDETWDEAEIKGQTEKGDGLDLYSKYRGVLVIGSSGTPGHTRLPAREKVHFVIDKSNIFDFERWHQSSGILAYKVNETLTSNHQVDYNSTSVSRNGGKYAVKIENIRGLIEMDPMPQSEEDILKGIKEGDYPLQYGYTVGDTPRENERCRVFQDRIQAMLVRVITKMQAALDNPNAPEYAEEIAMLNSLGRSPDAIRQRLKAINEDEIKLLTDMMVKLTAIHEMGHACGIGGHLNAIGKEDETLLRSPDCPMNYLYTRERRFFVLDRTLKGEGQFCSVAPDNCWKQLNVK